MTLRFTHIILMSGSLLIFGSSAALAYSCPTNIAAFDAAVAEGPNVSAEDLGHAVELRNKSEAKHIAGDHGGSIELINQALDLIGAE
ncbi:MAG: hypothetical protein V7776_11040 [Halopseudomonas aestusnigri]